MAQPLNLLARDDFQKDERGYATQDGVRKLTGAGVPTGAILVTALENVSAGKNGNFQEWSKSN